jgi:hypothetical protein
MTELSAAAQAVLCAYRDLSWTPDEEDNGKYLRFSHKAGMAAALRAAADQVDWNWEPCSQLLAIADELEGQL